ncbi:FUSC family protein [Micrococcus endophyticus]|uniref:FUSC family protein n=1 Tax=Micrococcus endophyticus TaxID=455343 RepID=UPI00381CE078
MRLAAVNPIPGLFTIAPADRDHEVGLRVGVTVLVPLLVLLATHRMDLAVYAVFGAFTGIYGRNLRHGPRLQAQLRGGGLMLAVLAAATLAGHLGVSEQADPWGLVLWTTVVAGVCAFVWALAVGMASRVHPGRRHQIVWPDTVLHDDGARRLILWEAAWYVVAAGVAGVVATLLAAPAGVHHNYWAMVAAVVPLVGHSARYRVSRGLQRVIGTFLGLVLTAGIILLDPPVIVLVLIIAVLQVAAELYIARQYVIAQTVVTPLALLSTMLVGVTAGGAGSLLAAGGLQHLADRGVETVIGAIVGIVCGLFPWAWRRWVWGSTDPTRGIPVVRPSGS